MKNDDGEKSKLNKHYRRLSENVRPTFSAPYPDG